MPTSAATITPTEAETMQLGKQGLNVDWLQPDILFGIDCYHALCIKNLKQWVLFVGSFCPLRKLARSLVVRDNRI